MVIVKFLLFSQENHIIENSFCVCYVLCVIDPFMKDTVIHVYFIIYPITCESLVIIWSESLVVMDSQTLI